MVARNRFTDKYSWVLERKNSREILTISSLIGPLSLDLLTENKNSKTCHKRTLKRRSKIGFQD